MRSLTLNFPAILGVLVQLGAPQTSHHFPTPPQPLDTQAQNSDQTRTPLRQIDFAKSRNNPTTSRVQPRPCPDVAGVHKGVLPKHVTEKLNQIEKLSKRLRTELNPSKGILRTKIGHLWSEMARMERES